MNKTDENFHRRFAGNERERGKSSRKKSHNSRNDLFMDSCFSFIVGEERLEAYVEDSELATNRTGETTATNLLKMTFTNKLFGFFFCLGRLSFWPYAMQPSTLKMRKCFRYKISHQFPLVRIACMHRERPEMHLGERWFRCFVVRKYNRSGKRSAAHELC